MARTARNAKIDTRFSRASLTERREPYPSLYPQRFMALEYAIPHEAHRLYKLASAEFDRLRPHREHDPALLARTRAELRVDELQAVPFGRAAVGRVADDGYRFPEAPDVLGAIRDGMAMLLDGVPEAVGPDPIHRAIAIQHAMMAAANAAPEEDEDEIARTNAAEMQARAAMLATAPTTLGGLLALMRAVEGNVEAHVGVTEAGGVLRTLGALLAALMRPASSAPQSAPSRPACRLSASPSCTTASKPRAWRARHCAAPRLRSHSRAPNRSRPRPIAWTTAARGSSRNWAA